MVNWELHFSREEILILVSLREVATTGWYVPSYHTFMLFFQVFDASVLVHVGLDLDLLVGGERKRRCVVREAKKGKCCSM
jgi:hypothetical protein